MPKQYPRELRERAVRLVAEHRDQYETEYAAIRPFTQRLVAAGFGYSCLPETGKKEVDEAIDDASIIEVLRDWSWSGPGSPPAWYAA